MFSFGLIKIQTTVNGAVTIVRGDDTLYNNMMTIQNGYPMQTKKEFVSKMFKGIMAVGFINTRMGTRLITWYAEKFTDSVEESIVSLTRGFKPGDDFLSRFRVRPGPCLLHFMNWRLENFDLNERELSDRKLIQSVETLAQAGIFQPGIDIKDRTFWLFPAVVENKQLLINYLAQKGVIAFKGATQLRYVAPAAGYEECPNAKWFTDNLVYLSVHST